MSETKTRRSAKRQFGQYMTPPALARRLLADVVVTQDTRVLEPSFGDGSFIILLIEIFLPLYQGSVAERLDRILTRNVFGVEIDPALYHACLDAILHKWKYLPPHHNLVCADYFCHTFYEADRAKTRLRSPAVCERPLSFDLIVGNPPFGGTIDPALQDELDKRYGFRHGEKIKKETYAFFVVKCLDELKQGGQLRFICSDTFMTIRTMRGLRRLLMEDCAVRVQQLKTFSDETAYPMALLELERTGRSQLITVDGQMVTREAMELTGNFSWTISDETEQYFSGPTLGDLVICSSGMTIGKNELFLREIVEHHVVEPYDFVFKEEPITVEGELRRARLHTLSRSALAKAHAQEAAGATRRVVSLTTKAQPAHIRLPHPDYRFYNKAASAIFYAEPTHAIFWRDEGDAVLTFKKSGNWYLHGVGGQPYFGREGLTWQLISSRLNARYLPEGYILDSGAPCAFLKREVDASELLFILGWLNTDLCSRLLKTVINHTKNIQSKDVERLPYPFWVPDDTKEQAIQVTRTLVEAAMRDKPPTRAHPELAQLESFYAWCEPTLQDNHVVSLRRRQGIPPVLRKQPQEAQLALWGD